MSIRILHLLHSLVMKQRIVSLRSVSDVKSQSVCEKHEFEKHQIQVEKSCSNSSTSWSKIDNVEWYNNLVIGLVDNLDTLAFQMCICTKPRMETFSKYQIRRWKCQMKEWMQMSGVLKCLAHLQELVCKSDAGASRAHNIWLGYSIGMKFYRELYLKQITVVQIWSFKSDIASTLFRGQIPSFEASKWHFSVFFQSFQHL